RASAADRGDTGESAYWHGGGRARGGPVTQLALVVPPPALHRAVRQQCTGVIGPGCDGVGAPDAAHCHRHGGTGRPRGRVGEGPVAELPELVPPRALRRPVGKEHTGILTSGRNGGGGDGVTRRELLRLTDGYDGIGRRYGESGRPSHLSPQTQPKAAEARGDEPQRSVEPVTHRATCTPPDAQRIVGE